jgi:homocysteine S-methyltransferase
MPNHPLKDLMERKGSVVIDGAMSTALEKKGCDLNDALWSAKVLIEEPQKIFDVHYDYFVSGANVAITASYQATEAGFLKKGLSSERARGLIELSARLASDARREFTEKNPGTDAADYLIAGAVGPYGAYLANGAEYTGDYSLTAQEYEDFHILRMQALRAGGADFFAFETLPRIDEASVLLALARRLGMSSWVTFTLRDSEHISSGESLADAARLCDRDGGVDAIGLNCVKRELVSDALKLIRSVSDKPLIVYPNSGEQYDPKTKTWSHPSGSRGWEQFVPQWHSLGALCIGGCCRTLPSDIVEIARLMEAYQK